MKNKKQNIKTIIQKINENKRINKEEGMNLLKNVDLLTLASLANNKRFLLHPDKIITYVVDRNINYTNVCVSKCRFCAFYVSLNKNKQINKDKQKIKKKAQKTGYVISKQQLSDKIKETIFLGGTQIFLQGGLNPELDIKYYVDLLEYIKKTFHIHIHGFSPPEINFIAKTSSLSIFETISILQKAGLDTIPGGGAEILCDDVRNKISPDKCSSKEWLEVMRQAHLQKMRTTATMMFGHIEKDFHLFEHMEKIRKLQDETHGFTAFIPWTFQPCNTKMNVNKCSSIQYLKVLALSRIFLDNIDNIQASWVTQGEKIAQMALFFGANDIGSTMIEENVVAAAGVDFMLSKDQLKHMIIRAGFLSKQRDCYYNIL